MNFAAGNSVRGVIPDRIRGTRQCNSVMQQTCHGGGSNPFRLEGTVNDGFDRDGVASYEQPAALVAIPVIREDAADGTTYEPVCGACGRSYRFTTTAHPGSAMDDADWHWDGSRWVCYTCGPYAHTPIPAALLR